MPILKLKKIEHLTEKTFKYIINPTKVPEDLLTYEYTEETKPAKDFIFYQQFAKKPIKIQARHMIQSFKIGDVTPKQAHEIGLELMYEIFKENFQYVLATHCDRDHIHNHILINNVSFRTRKAFDSSNKFLNKIRRTSDSICRKYGVHTLNKEFFTPEKGKSKFDRYKKWKEEQEKLKANQSNEKEKTKDSTKKEESYRKSYSKYQENNARKIRLKKCIDLAILKANSLDDFITYMENIGYIVKYRSEKTNKLLKNISFKERKYPHYNFIRSKSLGEYYELENIILRIIRSNKEKYDETNNTKKKTYKQKTRENESYFNKNTRSDYIDIEKAKGKVAYQNWIHRHNIHALNDIINGMREFDIKSTTGLQDEITFRNYQIKSIESKIELINERILELNVKDNLTSDEKRELNKLKMEIEYRENSLENIKKEKETFKKWLNTVNHALKTL